MKKLPILSAIIGISVLLTSIITWIVLFLHGKQFALRDRLQKADAIIVLAGTRGNIKFLHAKIRTAVRLHQEGWAQRIICTGKFSVKVTDTPSLITVEELQQAVTARRIQEKDVATAAKAWDTGLGAKYMHDQAVQMGISPQAILVECESLHTRENAEYVLALLREHSMNRVILVTSPFHQLRTYLTFAKVFQPHGIEIINYYADTGEWSPTTWFLSAEHRKLVKSEKQRIRIYRLKNDIL